MAIERLFLGAHEGNSVLRSAEAQPGEAFLEFWQGGYPPINHLATLVTFGFDPPRTQFLAKKDVPDAGSFQCGSELLPIELFVSTAVGMGTHVSHRVDAMIP
ncbi:MAG: hypothetical protein WD403_11330 [Pirellulales bacterium]